MGGYAGRDRAGYPVYWLLQAGSIRRARCRWCRKMYHRRLAAGVSVERSPTQIPTGLYVALFARLNASCAARDYMASIGSHPADHLWLPVPCSLLRPPVLDQAVG